MSKSLIWVVYMVLVHVCVDFQNFFILKNFIPAQNNEKRISDLEKLRCKLFGKKN
jgi:hypothetical protein